MTGTTRKLATIVALDVAGYSARTEADEARTTAEVVALRKAIEAIAAKHGGRVFNTAGDGFMLEFGSSLAAVEAAFELAETCEPKVRVGVHLGDVVVQPNGDLLGHGVNVAARLMAQSAPGAALVSGAVHQTIRGPLTARLQSRGHLKLDKMAETIEAFALAAIASGSAPTKTAEPLLAVLPFDNLSNDPEMVFFSDGVAEEIMQTLMRSAGLKVIGRTSAFQFRGERKALAAQALKATHILDGAVRRSGTKMRVSAQLTETATGTGLWGERYDRDVSDAFALQDEIAAKVAAALNQALPIARKDAAKIDSQAYDLYMKARPALSSLNVEVTRQAIPLLESAVARAPKFAAAWGALAFARAAIFSQTQDASLEPDFNVATAAVERALEFDAGTSHALLTQAALLPAFSAYAQKISLLEAAQTAEPNNPDVLSLLADAYRMVGRNSAALPLIERVLQLDPMSGVNRAMYVQELARLNRWPEAVQWMRLDHETSVRGLWWLPRMQWGRLIEFDVPAIADQFLTEHAPRFADAPPAIVPALRRSVRILAMPDDEREATLRRALDTSRGRALSLETCAFAARAGFASMAFDALFEALDSGRPISGALVGANAGALRSMTCGHLFFIDSAKLRPNPRFAHLCVRFGLYDYWRETGLWPDCVDEVAPYYDFKAECHKAARKTEGL